MVTNRKIEITERFNFISIWRSESNIIKAEIPSKHTAYDEEMNAFARLITYLLEKYADKLDFERLPLPRHEKIFCPIMLKRFSNPAMDSFFKGGIVRKECFPIPIC